MRKKWNHVLHGFPTDPGPSASACSMDSINLPGLYLWNINFDHSASTAWHLMWENQQFTSGWEWFQEKSGFTAGFANGLLILYKFTTFRERQDCDTKRPGPAPRSLSPHDATLRVSTLEPHAVKQIVRILPPWFHLTNWDVCPSKLLPSMWNPRLSGWAKSLQYLFQNLRTRHLNIHGIYKSLSIHSCVCACVYIYIFVCELCIHKQYIYAAIWCVSERVRVLPDAKTYVFR